MSGLNKRSVSLTFAANGIVSFLQLLQIYLLTKILSPADFGVIAISNAVAALVLTFQDMGLSAYVVHRQELQRAELASLYWFNIGLGSLLFLVVFLLSFPMTQFYGNPELLGVLQVLSLNFIVIAVGSQFQAQLQKNFQFEQIALTEISGKCIMVLASVWVAYRYGGPMSVAWGMLAGSLVKTAGLMWRGREYWPGLQFHPRHIRPAMKYGIFQLGGQVINQLTMHMDSLILGKLIGSEPLGLYALAKDLAIKISALVNPVVHRLALPMFARVQNDKNTLGALYSQALKLVSSTNALVYGLIILAAGPIVSFLYGAPYERSAEYLAWLCLFGAIRCCINPIGALLQAVGKTHYEFSWNIINMLVNISLVGVAAFHGINAVIAANIAAQLILVVLIHQLVLIRVITLTAKQYALALSPGLLLVFSLLLGRWTGEWGGTSAHLAFIGVGVALLVAYTVWLYFLLISVRRRLQDLPKPTKPVQP
jgi:exopolysaccharide (amylovoran) exporter